MDGNDILRSYPNYWQRYLLLTTLILMWKTISTEMKGTRKEDNDDAVVDWNVTKLEFLFQPWEEQRM